MGLRLQLTLVFGVFIAMILGAVAVSVYLLTERSLAAGLDERAETALAELVQGRSALGAALQRLPSDAGSLVLIVSRAETRPSSVEAIRNGVPQVANDQYILDRLPDSALQELIDEGRVAVTVGSGAGRLRVHGELGTVPLPSSRPFTAAFFVAVPAGLMATTLDQLARDLVMTVVLAFAAFGLGVWVLSQRVLGPLRRVTDAAAKVSGSDLSLRVPVPDSRDEIHDLGQAINNMLDRLQESFETQRRFTADASHELRTPVTAIAGHASYLLRRTNPTPAQQESLTVIHREAERMGKLVNDLLELARADAGFTVNKAPMNLVEVAEAVREEVSRVSPGAEVSVSARRALAEVMGDAERLKQVVLNLVMNAINAGASRVTVSVAQEGRQVRLEVLDDGAGIPPEALPHIFERFYRVDGARSTRGNGSGLGLAIVRWIVQQHDGTVSVESRLGEGTVFTILLPALDPKKTADTPALVRAVAGVAERRATPRG
ncbi:MAG TPA: ATP-binding protein [Trueperaceae bacterium]|nr:ATP-binding protein [Trueperaceae bacterium]